MTHKHIDFVQIKHKERKWKISQIDQTLVSKCTDLSKVNFEQRRIGFYSFLQVKRRVQEHVKDKRQDKTKRLK